MKNYLRLLLFAGLLVVGWGRAASAEAAGEILLIENGNSAWSIRIPEEGPAAFAYAASELQRWLREISDVTLPIVRGGAQSSRQSISLRIDLNDPRLREDGIAIHADPGAGIIVLTGQNERAVIYSAYVFLERWLGVRYLTKDCVVTPKLAVVAVPAIDYAYSPPFMYRETLYFDSFPREIAVQQRLNGPYSKCDEEVGGKWAFHPYVHSFNLLVPEKEYFAEHPEYYSLQKGQRKAGAIHAQLCLTNPAVLEIATRQVLRWIEEHPDVPIIDVSQNDGNGWCECESCSKVVAEEGSQHGPILRFVNAIAEVVAQKYPDKWIETLAYAYATKPPDKTLPRDNVIIRLCHTGCYFHGFEQCGLGANLTTNLAAWSQRTRRIFIWHYATNFAHYVAPNQNLWGLARDIKYYAAHGVNGLMVQANYQGSGGELAELRQYLAAQLMWEPGQDAERVIQDFCRGYYGAAGQDVLEYLALLKEAAANPGLHAFGAWDPASTVPAELVRDGRKILARGLDHALDQAVRQRVERLLLPLWYMQLTYPDRYGLAAADAPQLVAEFAQMAQRDQITYINEGKTMAVWLAEMKSRYGEAAAGSSRPWGVIVVDEKYESLNLAVVDLQRYVAQVIGQVPVVMSSAQWRQKPVAAIILGTVAGNELFKEIGIDAGGLNEQGFILSNGRYRSTPVLAAAGKSESGAVNGVYGLLREAGFGFYLGSEAMPPGLIDEIGELPKIVNPVFQVRGVLPWYNFFNSPTTWDPIDHRAFVDQLVRMGANFIGFHSYDTEPFAAYEEAGRMRWGQRLLNTQTPTWGTRPAAVSEFAFGMDRLFGEEYFGAASTQRQDDPNRIIKLEQDIMREALGYAKKRGLRPCIGFEINGDPTQAKDRDIFLKRLNHVLDQYPAAEYIWLWQHETQGVQGYARQYHQHPLRDRLDPNSRLVQYGQARRKYFQRVVEQSVGERPFYQDSEEGRQARAIEGARLEQFAMLAYRALSHRRIKPQLVISGWGGDQRLLSAEYYEGLDKLLPGDVVFASLDHMLPRGWVDRIYGELPPARQRWPILWLEMDGDEWQPQPFVRAYEPTVRDAHKGGSCGILGIHWRTRDIEENLAYLLEYAWNPQLTAEQFFRTLARKCYGGAIAEQMGQIHFELEKLGYRWVGGMGQNECMPFTWSPGDDAKALVLEQLRNQAAELSATAGGGGPRLDWLINRMDFTLAYHRAEKHAAQAQALLEAAKSADAEKAKALATEALKLLDDQLPAAAMRYYANRLTTRGEYGVLATMNTKAVASWRELKKRCFALLGQGFERLEDPAWPTERKIILPRRFGSARANEDLPVEPLVLGGGEAYLHYRTMGQDAWVSSKMPVKRQWVYSGVIPASAVQSPGVEFGFSFSPRAEARMDFGPVAVTVFEGGEFIGPAEIIPAGNNDKFNLVPRMGQSEDGLIELAWNDIPEADYYRVYRDNDLMVETAVSFFPDDNSLPCEYQIEAIRDGRVLSSATIGRK